MRASFVTKLLLVVSAASLALVAALTGYLLSQQAELSSLRAELLAEAELQAELLRAQPLDHALTPHLVKEIGFVLNPAMGRSTFKAHDGDTYAINSVGLRGTEIESKPHGAKRVLIVGDSVAFGWKLRGEDRLSSILNRRVAAQDGAAEGVEFVTVALPGWNVRSAAAFLESHLLLLDPDLILWWSIANDVEDVPGVIPPGSPALWASPHARDESPLGRLSAENKRYGDWLPTIARRRAANVERIAAFSSKHDIPVVILTRSGSGERARSSSLPLLRIPSELRRSPRWSLSPTDPHPTPWANRVLSVGILRELGRMGVLPPVEFSDEEAAMARAFEATGEGDDAAGRDAQVAKHVVSIPGHYRPGPRRRSPAVLYGVGSRGVMSRAGTLLLRNLGGASQLELRMEAHPNVSRYPGAADFVVRNENGDETRTTVPVDAARMDATLPLPPGGNHGVYEVSWEFDYVLCAGPSQCSPAKLLGARFTPG